MQKFLLYRADARCPQYFCGEAPDGRLLFCASKSLALMLPAYAAEVWRGILADRTMQRPLTLEVDVTMHSTHLQFAPAPRRKLVRVPRVEVVGLDRRLERWEPTEREAWPKERIRS
jgi:hypothetical protein